ncbi:MAG: MgtC/SapB family protein [Acidobacteriaceae bacterium]|nr:MgtC/SapB family protein [Acidobacteriaceae bacterium]
MNGISIQLFSMRFALAIVFGAVIGLERQWRQRMAGTRTNALVSAGACVFAMSGFLIHGDSSAQGRIVSYVVSGVGFLGAGVIFKENMQVRGLNTAATIWCSAAIGVITALGFIHYAAVVVLGVLLTNTVLRPLAYKLHPPSVEKPEEVYYHLECTCRTQDESRVRILLLQTVGRLPLTLYALKSEDTPRGILVDADLQLTGRDDNLLEQVVTRLSLEESVTAISWKLLPSPADHPQALAYAAEEES